MHTISYHGALICMCHFTWYIDCNNAELPPPVILEWPPEAHEEVQNTPPSENGDRNELHQGEDLSEAGCRPEIVSPKIAELL